MRACPASASDVADTKNVINLSFKEQLHAQAQIAKNAGRPFSIVISDRTQTVLESLQNAVIKTGGTIYRYTPSTGTFDVPAIVGNVVQ